MKCFNCEQDIECPVKREPSRHLTSPLSINHGKTDKAQHYYEHFCSEACYKQTNGASYRFFAMLDRNASDSACFEHNHWEKDNYGKHIRVGRCGVTGDEVRVEPLQPGDVSGQPKACYEHFILHSRYDD